MWYNICMITKTCEICGCTFEVRPYRANTARFCSFACGGKWHAQNRGLPHDHLKGNQFRKGKRPVNAFTSEQVSGENSPVWKESITTSCLHCGKTFERKPWMVRQNETKFCSQECYKAHNVGEYHWHYQGGPVTYRGRSWTAARKAAVERDNGTCQQCGKVVGKSIPVHHIKPYRTFPTPEEANSLDNLICLCQSCHMKKEYAESLPFVSPSG